MFHEVERLVGTFVSSGTQATDVIDNEHLRPRAFYAAFDGVVDVIIKAFVLLRHLGGGVKLGPVKAVGKIMGGVAFVIALLELLGGKLKIEVKHRSGLGVVGKGLYACSAGQLVPQLHGEDGFAEVGIGKQDAKLVLVPEVAKEHVGVGPGAFELQPAVGGVDGEEIVVGVGVAAVLLHGLVVVVRVLGSGFGWFCDGG